MTIYAKLIGTVLSEVECALRSVDPGEVVALTEEIRRARRIFAAGAGRSGLCLRAFAMRLMHLGLPVHVVGDATTPGLGETDLLLIGSGSGRTASLVEHAARAKSLKARVALITTASASPLGGHADRIVRVAAPTPKRDDSDGALSIQPMGSLFEQALSLLLDVVVLQLMADLNVSAEQMFQRHANLE